MNYFLFKEIIMKILEEPVLKNNFLKLLPKTFNLRSIFFMKTKNDASQQQTFFQRGISL